MKIDQHGLLQPGHYIPSPNCDDRPQGSSIDLLIIHNISLPPSEYGGNGVIELFTNCLDPNAHPYYETIKDARVSCHFFIRRDGEVIQFVPCGQRAWHAGVSSWEGRERCNDFSLGIELEGSDFEPFSATQYTVLAELTRALQQAYPVQAIAGHADIAPGRKTDPGPYFDWDRYRRAVGNLAG